MRTFCRIALTQEALFNHGGSSSTSLIKRGGEARRRHLAAEQRRRDNLCSGYRRLEDALPASHKKSSKFALIDRATTHIRQLQRSHALLQTRLEEIEAEMQRLRK